MTNKEGSGTIRNKEGSGTIRDKGIDNKRKGWNNKG